jgi:hypothetical protein
MPLRQPFYAMSNIEIRSRDEPHDTIVDEIIGSLAKHLGVTVGAEKPS